MSNVLPQSPYQRYLNDIERGVLSEDPAQHQALKALEDFWHQLIQGETHQESRGIYLWGNVGRGKTMLMDLFYQSLPEGIARRQHFHHFMSGLHKELNTTFGVANPLKRIAARIAREVELICFDEFFVSDIADAILLGNLIEALFDEGVALVATSNTPIAELFQDQLQKDRFAPAIALMQSSMQSFHLSGAVDHRMRMPMDQHTYFTARDEFQQALITLMPVQSYEPVCCNVNHRPLQSEHCDDEHIWCRFDELCVKARSAQDYMYLAQQFRCLIVSDIPELSSEPYERIKARGTEDGAEGSGQTGNRCVALGLNDDAVRRFISLVDECYDQGVQMIFHAAVPLDQLYTNGILRFEFQRTYSRISEMQTLGYTSR